MKMWIKDLNKRHYSQVISKEKVVHISSTDPPHDPDKLAVDKTLTYHFKKLFNFNSLVYLSTK